MSRYQICIIIPAYNESKVIARVIQNTQQAGFRNIIVVDDGSKDDTAKEAQHAGAYVIKHVVNRGKGAAIRTGLEVAKHKKAEIILTMDGDGQHNPDDIHNLILPILEGKADVVLGIRPTRPQDMPRLRWLATHLGNYLTWILSHIWVQDSQSGFRAFSNHATTYLHTQSNTYDYETEVIQLVSRYKLRYTEIPIQVAYTHHSLSKPHRQDVVNGFKTVFRLLWRVVS